MKISSFSAVFLAAATPFAAAAGLKGTERQLQTCPEQMCGRNSVAHFPAPRFDLENLPTLEELDAYYGTFCSFCEIGEILNPDIQFCDALCSFEIPDIEIPDFSEITTCFSEVSTVQVENVGSVTMKDLKGSNEYVQMQGGFAIMAYQNFIHMALSPFRMFTMGVSSAMGNTYTEDGLPTFAAAGINLGQWAESQNILVQAVLLVAFIAIAGASMVVENTFGPSLAPLALAAGAGAYALMKNNDVTFRASKIKSV
ncbi:expressed unknown protein [Seminavis robusta]|uniref:Uncharacterized protein n=1 Tax=Seminavis robusta TaxID=568900 RepID=A0A9N8DK41_9STRA|nr:expressed unknown protein [Seminavis robusta]|eukprot:Sro102_g052030.1 n/a (255) ;mRNA; r:51087-52244